MNKLAEMLKLIVEAHHGQFDKQGQPYAFHCIQVMNLLEEEDEELKCIALGHDLFEDTDVTFDVIYERFGNRIANGILAMTKMKGISYNDYISRILGNRDAILVKRADLRHNSDITRQIGITEKDLKRIQKYHRSYYILGEAINEG